MLLAYVDFKNFYFFSKTAAKSEESEFPEQSSKTL